MSNNKKSILDSVCIYEPPSEPEERKAYNEALQNFAMGLALSCSPRLAEMYEKTTGEKAPNWFSDAKK